jgi:hypothetical protein
MSTVRKIYLMTAHGTLVGVDDNSNLIQLELTDVDLAKLIHLEQAEGGYIVKHGAMEGAEIEMSPQGVSFIRNSKYYPVCHLGLRPAGGLSLHRATRLGAA